jgi:hypothetical protein
MDTQGGMRRMRLNTQDLKEYMTSELKRRKRMRVVLVFNSNRAIERLTSLGFSARARRGSLSRHLGKHLWIKSPRSEWDVRLLSDYVPLNFCPVEVLLGIWMGPICEEDYAYNVIVMNPWGNSPVPSHCRQPGSVNLSMLRNWWSIENSHSSSDW